MNFSGAKVTGKLSKNIIMATLSGHNSPKAKLS